MVPTTREEFKEYCLRALGDPVIEVNVSDDQVEDRVDEALYMFQQFHMDAVVKNYLKQELTPSTLDFTTDVANTFAVGERFRGATSNAVGQVVEVTDANTLTFFTSSGEFANGEVITSIESVGTGTISVATPGNYDLKYFEIPNSVVAVTKVFPPFDSRMSADILFDPQSQFNISLLSNFTANSIIPYVAGRQYQQLLNDTFRGRPAIRFQRHQGRLYLDISFKTTFRPGEYVIIECFQIIDPDDFVAVWGDRWLQRYAIALIKRQWGMNLSKYNGIQLPGGVTLDGQTMFTNASADIDKLEVELRDTFQLPIDFVVG